MKDRAGRMFEDPESEQKMTDAGVAIARHRKQRGMTLSDVAQATGLSMAHVSRIERGVRAPALGVLFRLSDAYGISLSELVGEDPDSESRVRHRPGMELVKQGREVVYRPLAGNDQPGVLRIILVDVPEDASTPVSSHPGSEWVYVIEGAVELHAASGTWRLDTGESYSFDAAQEHWLDCIRGPARFLLVTSSPAGGAPSVVPHDAGSHDAGSHDAPSHDADSHDADSHDAAKLNT